MTTMDKIVERSGARPNEAIPLDTHWGRCPVCRDRDYLWIVPADDGTAEVRCARGCAPARLLEAFGLDEVDVLERDTHSLTIPHTLASPGSRGFVDPIEDELLSISALADLPKPEPLIDETLDLRTVALLAGAPGTTKSFVALDWAASVASGTPWHDREVRQGRVLYLAGEGVYGIGPRLAAWQKDRGVEIPDGSLRLLPRAVQLRDEDAVDRLVSHVRLNRYAMVVIDTLARSSVGVDENSAEGMGRVVAAVERLKRAAPDLTVVLVHHTGKDGHTVRGSSSLEGAMDTVYLTMKDTAGVRLSRIKRKDGPPVDSQVLTLHEIPLDEEGVSSAVLKPVERKDEREIFVPARERAWTAWRVTFGDLEGSRAEFVRTLTKSFDLPSSSAYRAVAELESIGALDLVSDEGDPKKYRARPALARVHGLPNVKPFDGHLESDGPDLSDVLEDGSEETSEEG